MFYAYDINNDRRVAKISGEKGICPCCESEVIGCVGIIKQPYWRHADKKDCDAWYEPMSEWHIRWEEMFPDHWREVVLKKGDEKHRADVQLPNGVVIEFQKSPIRLKQILKRESFYNKMLWVFHESLFMDLNFHFPTGRFKNYLHACNMPFFVDMCNGMLMYVKKTKVASNATSFVFGKKRVHKIRNEHEREMYENSDFYQIEYDYYFSATYVKQQLFIQKYRQKFLMS